MTKHIADVAVIGAGIIGTCIAERLQHQGKQVLLIDKEGPGEGCSKGNAGHFATDIILPLANFNTLLKVPQLLLDPTGPLTIKWAYLPKLLPWLMRFTWAAMPHQTDKTIAALKQLNRPSIERFEQLLSRTGLTDLMTQRGALTVYETAKAARNNQAHAELVRQHGIEVETLNADAIKNLEPGLSEDVIGGLYYPRTAHSIDPYRLVTALASHFNEQGGQFKQARVKAIHIENDRQVNLITNGATIAAKDVIIACGAWSKPLVESLGHKVPLEAERGYHLMLPDPQVSLSRPVTSFEHSFVMTPMEQGLRLAGTVELASVDAPPNYQRATKLLDFAKKLLPGTNGAQASHWMGCRPSLPDSLPVIGRSPMHQNVLFAFGHQHLGLTQAAVTADIISEIVFEQPHSADINPYRVDRF